MPRLIHVIRRNKVDAMAYTAGLLGCFATLPQLFLVWHGPAEGVSLLSWVFYTAVSSVWLYYGFKNHQRPLILTQVCTVALYILMVIGIVVNGGNLLQ